MSRRPSDDAFRRIAKELYHSDGDLEFDDTPVISLSDDGGAYVQCWKWIYDSETEECETVTCKLCHEQTPAIFAHLHQGAFIGDDCCWDERLRTSE